VSPEPPASSPEIPERDISTGRLLASVAYLPGLCFVGLLGAPQNRYVGFHARQGFLLFMVELVAWLAIGIYDASLGRIPVLGFLVGAVIKFVAGMGLLAMTVYGVIKGAGGELARIPYLGDSIERVPF
jgi:uncharacterized membrane protein